MSDLITRVNVTGPAVKNDGDFSAGRGGNYGESIVSQLFGKYLELSRRNLVFVARSGAAAAIPINTTLTNSPTLWNPADSGKIVVPLRLQLSVAAIGTPVLTSLTLSYLTNTGSVVATGNPLATFTNIAPKCVSLGKGSAATTKFANATVTFTANPTALMDIGIHHWLEGTAGSGQMGEIFHDFDGTLVMPPGTSISVGATAATSTTFWTSILFAELAVPNGF